ncbi:hypothetical protein J6590_008685 [Homalodisca vitripennis]|nr:hypothetical protein J6590_008685 [Homalodisca vitripennis]
MSVGDGRKLLRCGGGKKPPGPAKTVHLRRLKECALHSSEAPSRSIQKRESALGLRPSQVRKIFVTHLKFHPFKLAVCPSIESSK